ncbi:ASKHA domain-containing protein [Desulfitobacterium sp. PCE1]|uniref:ASKHA domain-containing protein n=1 Tax=Desulfitobacterium sp. PCE1 TaxID=146907 RepID=UPI000364F5B9|nr:ASKHA domain-containing protein [Desulfitobacterium sp. PCE1]
MIEEMKNQIIIDGQNLIIAKNSAWTLMDTLTDAGVPMESVCGGKGTCGKCKVRVLSGEVMGCNGSFAEPEKDGSYLACRIYPLGQVVLDKITKRGVTAKGEIGRIHISSKDRVPVLRKSAVRPTYPTLTQNYSLQEMVNKVNDVKYKEMFNLHSTALQDIPLLARTKTEIYTLIHLDNNVTAVEAGDTSSVFYGVAFDIGSTTVAGMLMDMNRGEVVASAAETNPQTAYGADVISRIKAAEKSEGLKQLSDLIRHCLNNLICKLCSVIGIRTQDIYLMTIVGNSTMEHLLMGISPISLTIPPYVQVFKSIPPLPPQELSLDIHSGGRVVLIPNIASFVGADTTAAVMAVDQDLTPKLTLLIDLGTNGEIVLGNRERMIVTSTAAGPAFEGAQLSCGMRATDGAIDDIVILEDVHIRTINDQKPAGICGSGIIKALAEMVRRRIITFSGRFVESSQMSQLPPKLRSRIRERDGQREFVLAFAEESANGSDIVITQGDVRELQLVKSSICTGSQILMQSFGVNPEEIEQVFIAGAFGSFVDLDSALAIGLIPVHERKRVRSVGNAAGEGAAKALLSNNHIQRCQAIAEKAEFIELANHPQFQKSFIKNLAFPEEV